MDALGCGWGHAMPECRRSSNDVDKQYREERRLVDEDGRQDEIHDQIAASMFAALLDLDKQIRKIMTEAGLSEEDDEWIEENHGV